MADDPRQQDRHSAGPDAETIGDGGRTERPATEGIRSVESSPGGTARASQPQQGGQAPPGVNGPPPRGWQVPPAGPPQAVPGRPPYAPWQPPYAPWQPGSWDVWQAAPAPFAWPAPYPASWAPSSGTVPGYVPWGYSNPPAVPPVLEPPGRFHSPAPRRSILSSDGRASPTLYSVGLALGLPGLLALLSLELAPRMGWKLGLASLPAWILVETICAVAAVGLILLAIAQSRQRRADGWHDYAGPSPFLVMAALLAVVTGLGEPLAGFLKTAGVDTDSATGILLLLLVYLGSYIGLVHFLAVRPGALTWRDVIRPSRLAPDPDDWASTSPQPAFGDPVAPPTSDRQSRARGRIGDILLALAMLLPIVFVSGIVNQALMLVLGLKARDLSSPVPTSSGGLDPLIAIFAVAVIVPIGEEIFFRGFATNAWGRSLGRNSAILRAALFFAFIHILNVTSTEPGLALRAALFNFGARVPVSIALTWLYFRRRSILASGTLHASFNGLIQALSLLNS